MDVSDSEERRKKILELIIEAYVSTASPVGSERVARRLRSTLSPATIRNVMGDLETAGLIEQPHTSAGRVPTDRGYRFYVDAVMDVRQLALEQLRQMEEMIQPREPNIEELLARAAGVLSEATQQAAFVVAPSVRQSTVKQIELVPISVRKILCVLVANEEMVASHMVEIQEPMSREEANALARFINTELVGISFNHLLDSLERRMLAENDSFYHLVKRCLNILQHALSTEPQERLFLEGTSLIVDQPEFSRNPRRAHELLRGLDEEELLMRHIRQDVSGVGVHVRIGHELQVPGLEECSYLAAPFGIAGEVGGGLGVLGPKRMDYPRMYAFVDAMGRCVTALLTRWDET